MNSIAVTEPTRPRIRAHSLVHVSLLHSLERLWDGPLTPFDLQRAEMALRALFVTPNLSVLRVTGPWESGGYDSPAELMSDSRISTPFDDHLLDYEFSELNPAINRPTLPADEKDFLDNLIKEGFNKELAAVLPDWLRTVGEAHTFIDLWYEGCSVSECEQALRLGLVSDAWADERTPFNKTEYLAEGGYGHVLFHMPPRFDAQYMVECHRAGLCVFGEGPIARLANEHLFSQWPNALFDRLDEEYRKFARAVRGPGVGIELPVLTALVLSRANHRNNIPETIRDIRESYTPDRTALWERLEQMWYARSAGEQMRSLQGLEKAAESIFKAAFPQKFRAISVGWELGKLSPAGVVGAVKAVMDHNEPRLQVSAVSFAEHLANDLHHFLQSNHAILQRHLTASERRNFGM